MSTKSRAPARHLRRDPEEQRLHDVVAVALGAQYERLGHPVFVNRGPKKSMGVQGKYPDVVVMKRRGNAVMHVIEVETGASVNAVEAARQWTEYDEVYERWFLAVPKHSRAVAKRLIGEHDLQRVELITWSFDFAALP